MQRFSLPTLFILMTIVIDSMGIGLMLPVMPDLIAEVRGVDISRAALWGGILASSFALMQFVFSPILGNLSDRYGRRPVLLVSLAVMSVDYLIMALAESVWLLLIGRIIGGMTAATMAVAMAYMADTSPPEKRGQNFGLISASFGLGFMLGPALGGVLGDLDPRAPFYAAAALGACNFVLGYFFVPETLPIEKRRPFEIKRANPVGGLLQIGRLPGAYGLLAALLCYQIATSVYPSIWSYYTQTQFGWDLRIVGLSLTIFGLSMVVVQGGLIRVIFAKIGQQRAVIYGLGLNVACLLAYGLTPYGWLIWPLLPISAVGAVVAPALQGLVSGIAAEDQQGELQGVISSISAIAMIISPFVMTRVFFAYTNDEAALFLPGAPFLLASVLMVGAWAIYSTRGRTELSTAKV